MGTLVLVSDGVALTALRFGGAREATRLAAGCARYDGARPFVRARRELAGYFAGRLAAFTLLLAPRGTPFQLRVWEALRLIPRGATATYGRIAQEIGTPKAARAVGAACRANPIVIVIPCHRVVGADGSLTGYAGGLDRKQRLLCLEGKRQPPAT